MLATTALGVRRAQTTTDGHGTRRAASWAPVGTVLPGRIDAEPPADGETDGPGVWRLGVDARLWPIAARDLVVEPSTGREWAVLTARHHRSHVDQAVDWVAVEAHLR